MQQNFIYNFLQGNTQKEIYKSTKKNLTVNNILYNLPSNHLEGLRYDVSIARSASDID